MDPCTSCYNKERRIAELEAGVEGVRRLLSGEQVGVSTGIDGSTTYGYGDLDDLGFWQFPVPEALVELRRQVIALEGDLAIARSGHFDPMGSAY